MPIGANFWSPAMNRRSWQDDERQARRYLEFVFGQKFGKRRLPVALPGGEPKLREFDAVSLDGSIVAQVKAYTTGHQRELQNVTGDAVNLYLCKAQRKFLFLTDPLFYQLVWRRQGQELLTLRRQGVEFVSPWEFAVFCQNNNISGSSE